MLFDMDLGTPKTWKSVFYLHHMLIFKDPRVREITPKIAPKSLKICKKTCLEILCLWCSFFYVLLDFMTILAPFWSSEGHLGAFKVKSISNMAPRWSLKGLRGSSGVDFGVILAGVGEESSKIERFWPVRGQILGTFGKMWPYCSKASTLDPRADPRSVTMRGGPLPQRVE